jgi:carbon storage regulator
MLILTRRKNESVVIDDDVAVTVVEIRGDKVRLGIVCPKEVSVHRHEVWQAVHREGWPQPRPFSLEEAAFFQAIAADPGDEDIRLVFADWLEERGDPLGEFLRTQCRLASLPLGNSDRQGLEKRSQVLWAKHGTAWRASLPGVLWSFSSGGC